jgi:ABC-type multidrug transport system permease subunit
MILLFFIFQSSWGQWICAFAPSFTVISNILPFFFVMFGLFNGVVRPYADLPIFWQSWMYWANPATYYVGGVLAATLHAQPVQCAIQETARFNVPSGQTCLEYAGAFAQSAGGYMLNPDAISDCQYCPYTTSGGILESFLLSASATGHWSTSSSGVFASRAGALVSDPSLAALAMLFLKSRACYRERSSGNDTID